jgi:hypothetical protein
VVKQASNGLSNSRLDYTPPPKGGKIPSRNTSRQECFRALICHIAAEGRFAAQPNIFLEWVEEVRKMNSNRCGDM